MRRRRTVLPLVVVLAALAVLAGFSLLPAATPDSPTIRRVRLGDVDLSPAPAKDLASPEGKTLWDLTRVSPRNAWTRSLQVKAGTVLVEEERPGKQAPEITRSTYSDPAGGDAAVRWWYPDRDPGQLRMGSRTDLTVDVAADDGTERLEIGIEVVGIGWLHLPSSPHEVVLQRVHFYNL